MGILARDSGGDLEPIPVGIHRALCINVFDVGIQKGFQDGPPAHKVVVLWELEPRSETSGKRYTITKTYTLSIHDKSTLGADLTSWRGKTFTEEERQGFDLDKIKGKPCQLNIVPNGDKAKVASVLPAQRERDKDGASVPSIHWAAETSADYIPKFVTRIIGEQLTHPTTRQAVADDPTEDVIF